MDTLHRMKTPGHLIVSCYQEEPTTSKPCRSQTIDRSSQKSLFSRLSALWQQFSKDQQEPRIWQSADRQGNCHWYVYDPDGQRSLSFATEEEIRAWLEVRHRRAAGMA